MTPAPTPALRPRRRSGPSGPRTPDAELSARGAGYRTIYLDPEWAAQLERLRVREGLPETRWLGALLKLATNALEAAAPGLPPSQGER